MAACAPPIAVARAVSTVVGHGAPSSFTLLSAYAADASKKTSAIRICAQHTLSRVRPGCQSRPPQAG